MFPIKFEEKHSQYDPFSIYSAMFYCTFLFRYALYPKWQIRPGLGFGSFPAAYKTIQGYEVMNMIRKGQMAGIEKGNITEQNQFIAKLFGLAA